MLLIGVAAIALFVVGPQGGSVDDDADGSPDIPIVVTNPVDVADVSARVRAAERRYDIDRPSLSRRAFSTRDVEIPESNSPALNEGSVLYSWCSLRC